MNLNDVLLFGCLFLVSGGRIIRAQSADQCVCKEWGEWSAYSACSRHCDGGLQSRSRGRDCDQTLIEDNSVICTKNETQWRFCNTQDCGCDNACSEWSPWNSGQCSTVCGGGELISTRQRQCQGGSSGLVCPIKDSRVEKCNTHACTGCHCGSWSVWSQYSQCSASCGDGVQNRYRTKSCVPEVQGYNCGPASRETVLYACNLRPCCTDPGMCTAWSDWRDTDTCSTTCNNGIVRKRRTRMCILPDCLQEETKSETCNIKTCIETCNNECLLWSSWNTTSCSKSCGGGWSFLTRSRKCDKHPDCKQNEATIQKCNTHNCLSCDEACSTWSGWSAGACSKQCDTGTATHIRTRNCSVPQCDWKESKEDICKLETCPETCNKSCGTWSSWSTGSCSKSCDTGTQEASRTRSCPHADCQMAERRSDTCNLVTCSETCDKTCSEWAKWQNGSCTTSCDTGLQNRTRTRFCQDPDCRSKEQTLTSCVRPICEETCNSLCTAWSNWNANDVCSVTCGDGQQRLYRTRICSNNDCRNHENRTIACNTKPCEDRILPGGCKHGDYIPHPDCTKYYRCVWGVKKEISCPSGTGWNNKQKICDHTKDSDCNSTSDTRSKKTFIA